MKLTYKQNANLFHILVIFPLIYITIHPEIVENMPIDVLRNLVTFIMIAGTMYHLYMFIEVNNKSVRFDV